MPIFQCTGCPKGPHIAIGLDPEFDPEGVCFDQKAHPENVPCWRRLGVVSE